MNVGQATSVVMNPLLTATNAPIPESFAQRIKAGDHSAIDDIFALSPHQQSAVFNDASVQEALLTRGTLDQRVIDGLSKAEPKLTANQQIDMLLNTDIQQTKSMMGDLFGRFFPTFKPGLTLPTYDSKAQRAIVDALALTL